MRIASPLSSVGQRNLSHPLSSTSLHHRHQYILVLEHPSQLSPGGDHRHLVDPVLMHDRGASAHLVLLERRDCRQHSLANQDVPKAYPGDGVILAYRLHHSVPHPGVLPGIGRHIRLLNAILNDACLDQIPIGDHAHQLEARIYDGTGLHPCKLHDRPCNGKGHLAP